MPRYCCVPNCTSNRPGKDYVSCFRFPKDPQLKALWKQKIPRAFEVKPDSAVCAKHFQDEDILTVDLIKMKDGSIYESPRTIPKLADNAVPSIFPGCPAYLTETNRPRTVTSERLAKMQRLDDQLLDDWMEKDKISDFNSFKEGLHTTKQLTTFIGENSCLLHKCDKCVTFIFFSCDNSHINKSLKINQELVMSFSSEKKTYEMEKFRDIFSVTNKLKSWSGLEHILGICKQFTSESELEKSSFLNKAISFWEKFIEDECCFEHLDCAKFLLEQMTLINKSNYARKYSTDTLIFAYCVYLKSSAAYSYLQSRSILQLPTLRHLKRLCGALKVKCGISTEENISYLKGKCKNLTEDERVINLLLDEIYVKSCISYKGGNLTGITNNPEEQATKMQVFMLSSIFSKTKEIIALVPVTNLNAQDLYDLVLKCLKMLHEIGFTVLTIISDNNRMNRNMFVKLCGGKEMKLSILNPFNDSQKIFLLFDTVHILKSVRNNWVSQKDQLKCFTYQNPTTSKTNSASFTVLDCLYKSECNSIIKVAPKLTVKALNPSSLEKQNVKLALKIFDRSNIESLKLFVSKDKNITHKLCINTSFFIEQIVCWWEIMNIKTPDKGKRLRLEFCEPFRSIDDKRFTFLNSFVKWLKDWESKNQKPKQGGLSRETFFSLIHTTECMCEIIKYLLTFSPYVLCGKFQTDNLEARFGQYRQMSGSNYYISVEQILEAEKKLRIKSILHLKSKMYGTFSLKNLISTHTCDEESSDIQLPELLSSVLDDCLDFDILSKNDLKVLTYISGYCAFKLKISCTECCHNFLTEKTMDLDLSSDKSFEYLNILDRGGLRIPSKFTVMVVSACYLIFLRLISSELEAVFLSSCNQANILKYLTLSYMESVEDFDKNICSKCNCPKILTTVKIIGTMCNICLNNYAKKRNEVEKQKKDERKIKKLKSEGKK